MAQQSIRKHISRIKGALKINNADARLTDRHIYALMEKHAPFLLKRDQSWLRTSTSVYQSANMLGLIEVDTVEACGIETDCKIKRTKNKLPKLMENMDGPIIRRVTSIDGATVLTPIESSGYYRKIKKSTAKYDKSLYYWYLNEYLYFPNIQWDAIRVEGYFHDIIGDDYDECCCGEDAKKPCTYKQDELFIFPDFLVSAMDQLIFQDLSIYLRIPQDQLINKNENIKL